MGLLHKSIKRSQNGIGSQNMLLKHFVFMPKKM